MKLKLAFGALLLGFLTITVANPAGAQEVDAFPQAIADNLWVLIAAVLVFFMQAGFAMVEGGLTRSKNVSNIMAKNLADACLGVLVFFCVGYGIAFGGGNDFFGTEGFFLSGAEKFPAIPDGLTVPTIFIFQAVFAATAVTICSGAMAERTKFTAYLVFGVVMTAVIYPVVVHWTWGGGFISKISIGDAVYTDFAGSTIVHSTGAWAALVGASILGPRMGKYSPTGEARAIPGHNMALTVLGVFILWVGWFGFNGGSELAADTFVMHVALTTLLSGCAGVLGAGITARIKTGVFDLGMTANGALAGLVGITAGTGTMNYFGALVTGFIAGVIVIFAVLFIEKRLKIDDPVGAIAVHGVCGVWGTLAVGLFARYDDAFLGRDNAGLLYGGGINQLIVQALFVVIVAAWVLTTSYILFKILDKTMGLRVSAEEEAVGLDIAEHGSPGYGETATWSPVA
jgi:ammonium transporter, Amt family